MVDTSEVSLVAKAKKSFQFFAQSEMIDQSHYGDDGVIVKDFHQEWVDAVENHDRVAITAHTGCGKCLAEGTRIPLADGSWKKIEEVERDDVVLSANDDLEVVERRVTDRYNNGEKEVYLIKTRNGRSIKATSNHEFLTPKGWVSIEHGLSEGDYLTQPTSLPTSKEDNISEAKAAFIGLIIAEGALTGGSVSFSASETEIVDKLGPIVSKLFDAEISESGGNYRVVNKERTKGLPNRARSFLEEQNLWNKKSTEKEIPDSVMSGSTSVKSEFLGWLWAGDGTIGERGISITLSNEALIKQVQEVLLSLEILSNVSVKKTNGKRNSYRLIIETQDSIRKFEELINIPLSRKEQRLSEFVDNLPENENTNTEVVPLPKEKLSSAIESYNGTQKELAEEAELFRTSIQKYKYGERRPSKSSFSKLSRALDSSVVDQFDTEDFRWEEIVSIERIGKEQVYDIGVEGSHNFIANGVVSHNSTILGVLYPLWKVLFEGADVLVVSNALAQSTKILSEIKHHILNSEYLEDLKPDDRHKSWSKTEIELDNGSKIFCKPLNENVKSVHVDYVICTPGYTRVETPDGARKIKDIEPGDKVKTHKGRFKKVKRKMSRETSETGYEIHAGGMRLRLTSNHPLRSEGEWVKAENLEEGQILEYPVDTSGISRYKFPNSGGKKVVETKVDREFGELLGWYMAEGSLTDRSIRITNSNEQHLDRISDLLESCFDSGITVDDHLDWSTNILYSSVDVREKFVEWFGEGAKSKRVPDILFDMPEQVRASFMEGWIKGDGTDVYSDSDGSLKHTILYTTSEDAVEGAKDIIESIGGECSVSKYSNEGSTYGGEEKFHIRIERRTAQKIKALASGDIEDGRLLLEVGNIVKSRVSHWSRDNKVYNLEVEDDNSYIANGIATHNCDEAAEFDKEIYRRFVKTRIASKGGTACLISTPVHENDLMQELSEGELKLCNECEERLITDSDGNYLCDEHGEITDPKVNSNLSKRGYWNDTFPVMDEDGNPNYPERFDKKDIRQLRSEDPTSFQKEYMCQPLAVEGDLFDPNDIIECYDKEEGFEEKPKENCDYILGADFAVSKEGDYSVYIVLEQDRDNPEEVVIRYMERIRGMKLSEQEDRIENLHNIFDFKQIILDETNFGIRTLENLRDRGLPVEGQSFERKARNNLIVNLKKMIEKQELVIPRAEGRTKKLTDKLYHELLGFGSSETQSGSVTYKSTAKHDDTVMALGMAASKVQKQRPVVPTVAH